MVIQPLQPNAANGMAVQWKKVLNSPKVIDSLDSLLLLPMDCIIPFDWDVKTLFPLLPVRPAGRLISPASVRSSAMELPMENLLVGKDDAGEQEEQWKSRPGPPEHDDSQDEGDPQSEMENGTNHSNPPQCRSRSYKH